MDVLVGTELRKHDARVKTQEIVSTVTLSQGARHMSYLNELLGLHGCVPGQPVQMRACFEFLFQYLFKRASYIWTCQVACRHDCTAVAVTNQTTDLTVE